MRRSSQHLLDAGQLAADPTFPDAQAMGDLRETGEEVAILTGDLRTDAPYTSNLVPAVNPPREPSLAARIIMAVLGLLDRVTLAVDDALELSMEDLDRAAHVAGFVTMRQVYAESVNARRRGEWRARYGGKEICAATLTLDRIRALTAQAEVPKLGRKAS